MFLYILKYCGQCRF